MKTVTRCNLVLANLLLLTATGLHAQDGDRLSALAANDRFPTFSLTLSSKSPEYRLGSMMWVTIVQTNLTNHDIDCSYTDHFEAIDEYGQAIKEYSWVPEEYAHGCALGVGDKYSHMQQLEHVFKFTRPGNYKFRVLRKEPFIEDEKGDQKVVYSNWITITIAG